MTKKIESGNGKLCHVIGKAVQNLKYPGRTGVKIQKHAFQLRVTKILVGTMTEEPKDKIREYLSNHYYLNLATVSPQGRPMAHTMAYVSEGIVVYIATNKNTRKVQNIMQNPYVAYTVDEDDPDWFDIQALQIEGKASIITDEGELREAGEILVAKFPVAADMPPDPDSIMIKIEPEVIYYLDYSIEFGYREQVNL